MTVTVLAENTSDSGLPCEHGLSLYLRTGEHTLLFDMGQTDLFARNAARLGLSLEQVEMAVLSHGHYDHGGGLRTFLSLNHRAKVYLSRCAFEPHYNSAGKYIGLDTSLQGHPQLVMTDGVTEWADGITLHTGHAPSIPAAAASAGLYRMENGRLVPDDFRHEQYLLVEEDGRRLLISGCSHKGVRILAAWFRPHVLIGGFHLMSLPADERLRPLAEALDGFDTDYYTCHCTGVEQYRFMKPLMRRLHYLSTGQTVQI